MRTPTSTSADSDVTEPVEPSDDGPSDADGSDVGPSDAGMSGGGGWRRFGTAALALSVVVGLVLGYALGWLTPRLTAPGEDSVEVGFARDMIQHHAQAVDMGLAGFSGTEDSELRGVAVDVITGQSGEIGMMHTWLDEWGVGPNGSAPPMAWMPEGMRQPGSNGLMPGMATTEEIEKLRTATGREHDILFLQYMIRHHLGGVHMIDAVLAASDRDEVVKAARVMKNTQQKEMSVLRDALARLGGTPLPAN